jgi:hypothetical protein
MQESGARHKTKGMLNGATDKLKDFANGERERPGTRRGGREVN